MTLDEHKKKFGHTKFYNKIVNVPSDLDYDYNNLELLSSLKKKHANGYYKHGFYMESRIKPCPFCSGEAHTYTHAYGVSGIVCGSCNARIFGSKMLKRWNRRMTSET